MRRAKLTLTAKGDEEDEPWSSRLGVSLTMTGGGGLLCVPTRALSCTTPRKIYRLMINSGLSADEVKYSLPCFGSSCCPPLCEGAGKKGRSKHEWTPLGHLILCKRKTDSNTRSSDGCISMCRVMQCTPLQEMQWEQTERRQRQLRAAAAERWIGERQCQCRHPRQPHHQRLHAPAVPASAAPHASAVACAACM